MSEVYQTTKVQRLDLKELTWCQAHWCTAFKEIKSVSSYQHPKLIWTYKSKCARIFKRKKFGTSAWHSTDSFEESHQGISNLCFCKTRERPSCLSPPLTSSLRTTQIHPTKSKPLVKGKTQSEKEDSCCTACPVTIIKFLWGNINNGAWSSTRLWMSRQNQHMLSRVVLRDLWSRKGDSCALTFLDLSTTSPVPFLLSKSVPVQMRHRKKKDFMANIDKETHLRRNLGRNTA